ncbi:MAG: hypothetical protein ACI9N1_000774 [Flavobacteriales bacterium]|jgi:hypothetical protein
MKIVKRFLVLVMLFQFKVICCQSTNIIIPSGSFDFYESHQFHVIDGQYLVTNAYSDKYTSGKKSTLSLWDYLNDKLIATYLFKESLGPIIRFGKNSTLNKCIIQFEYGLNIDFDLRTRKEIKSYSYKEAEGYVSANGSLLFPLDSIYGYYISDYYSDKEEYIIYDPYRQDTLFKTKISKEIEFLKSAENEYHNGHNIYNKHLNKMFIPYNGKLTSIDLNKGTIYQNEVPYNTLSISSNGRFCIFSNHNSIKKFVSLKTNDTIDKIPREKLMEIPEYKSKSSYDVSFNLYKIWNYREEIKKIGYKEITFSYGGYHVLNNNSGDTLFSFKTDSTRLINYPYIPLSNKLLIDSTGSILMTKGDNYNWRSKTATATPEDINFNWKAYDILSGTFIIDQIKQKELIDQFRLDDLPRYALIEVNDESVLMDLQAEKPILKYSLFYRTQITGQLAVSPNKNVCAFNTLIWDSRDTSDVSGLSGYLSLNLKELNLNSVDFNKSFPSAQSAERLRFTSDTSITGLHFYYDYMSVSSDDSISIMQWDVNSNNLKKTNIYGGDYFCRDIKIVDEHTLELDHQLGVRRFNIESKKETNVLSPTKNQYEYYLGHHPTKKEFYYGVQEYDRNAATLNVFNKGKKPTASWSLPLEEGEGLVHFSHDGNNMIIQDVLLNFNANKTLNLAPHIPRYTNQFIIKNNSLLTCDRQGISEWDMPSEKLIQNYWSDYRLISTENHFKEALEVGLTPSLFNLDSSFFAFCFGNIVDIWDADSRQLTYRYIIPEKYAFEDYAIEYSRIEYDQENEELIVVFSTEYYNDNRTIVIDTKKSKVKKDYENLNFLNGSTEFIQIINDSTIKLLNFNNEEMVYSIPNHGELEKVLFNDNRKYIYYQTDCCSPDDNFVYSVDSAKVIAQNVCPYNFKIDQFNLNSKGDILILRDIYGGANIRSINEGHRFDELENVTKYDTSSEKIYYSYYDYNQKHPKVYDINTGEIQDYVNEMQSFSKNDVYTFTDGETRKLELSKYNRSKRIPLDYLNYSQYGRPGGPFLANYKFSHDNNHVLTDFGEDQIQSFNVRTGVKDYLTSIPAASLNDFGLLKNDSLLVTSHSNEMNLWNSSNGDKILNMKFFSQDEFIMTTPDNYYYSKVGNLNDKIYFEHDLVAYPFEQFDLKYNRPDIILERIGYADSAIINAYHKAYLKRLKKMGFTEDMLKADFHLPEIKIENFEYMPTITDSSSIRLNLNIEDTKYNLDRINIWINDVAVYGSNGISLRDKNIQNYQTKVDLKLVNGNNKVQVSVLNQAGAESYKETFEVECASGKTQPDLYLITIGDSKFKDANYNLTYAAKDAQDIADIFSESKVYGKVNTKTLTNKEVTKENIKGLRSFLEQADINDEVMVFVAGHGVLDEELDYFFATYDMDFNNPSERGLAYEDLEGLLDGIAPLKKTLLIDACHSGEIDKEEVELMAQETTEMGDVQFRAVGNSIAPKLGMQNTSELTKSLFTDLRKGTGATVISSAGGMEFAMEGGDWQNGLFTYCLINGLKSKDADLNDDGEIWLSELKQYVQEQVASLSNGKQQPTSRIENNTLDYRVW